VFRLRIALLVALGALGGSSHAGGQAPAPPSPQTVKLPVWLSALPKALDEHTRVSGDEINSSYRILQTITDVAAHYREQMKKAEIPSTTSFDGIGTVIRCSDGKASCVIQIRESDEGTSVRVNFSLNVERNQPAFFVPRAPSASESPAPLSAPAAPKKTVDDNPGLREVEYEITGTVHYANLTRKNADGSSEQRQEHVPYSDKFFASPGTVLYLSVQKARITIKEDFMSSRFTVVEDGIEGTVCVVIRVGGVVLQKAEASAAYGIATVSGIVPE
jgi:hypothetical protein